MTSVSGAAICEVSWPRSTRLTVKIFPGCPEEIGVDEPESLVSHSLPKVEGRLLSILFVDRLDQKV